ncbi:hypothetical protein D3C86_2077570 [compost metagenome]
MRPAPEEMPTTRFKIGHACVSRMKLFVSTAGATRLTCKLRCRSSGAARPIDVIGSSTPALLMSVTEDTPSGLVRIRAMSESMPSACARS